MHPTKPTRDLRPLATDASHCAMRLPADPKRIVSLVPSVTEALFALGLGERVVGVTDWCLHPAAGLARVPRVGGTKNPRIAAIVELAPDLVLANLEENREIDVRRLRQHGLTVWVDYPRTVDQALEQLDWLSRLGATPGAAARVLEPIVSAVTHARASAPPRLLRGFVAVWKDPWTTLSADTYGHDLLALCGIHGLFARAIDRYPRVSLDDVAARAPEIVLLPDEPYHFTEAHAHELAQGPLARTVAARHGRIHVIDGTLLFWHGPRIVRAIQLLRGLAGLADLPS